MESYDTILNKLSSFVTKYYKTQMIKGAFLFLALGLVFWLLLLTLEYFFWLGKGGRMMLFLLATLGTIVLLVKYVGVPLIYLFRLKQGLSLKDAAKIIGNHFPGVGDRLVNLLDLASDDQRTELLLASIEQRSLALSPVPFQRAIDFKKSLRYARYAALPLLLIGVIWASGKIGEYLSSLDRVVHYDLAYERPAPFSFLVLNSTLKTIEKQDYTLHVTTEGSVKPENVYIVIGGREMLMQEENGQFVYTFTSPVTSQEFFFRANNVRSVSYTLETLAPPVIEQFFTVLDYPDYTQRATDTVLGTGNALIPEGTKVKWLIRAMNTENVSLITSDTVSSFGRSGTEFKLDRVLENDLAYEIATSNGELKDYERLGYNIGVVRDEPPMIEVAELLDSISNTLSYEGRIIDDYSISRLTLIYYESGNEEEAEKVILDRPGTKDYLFAYDFPTGLNLSVGKVYNYYFEATDNDARHGGKSVRSRMFTSDIPDEQQLKDRKIEDQRKTISDWDKSMEIMERQQDALKELEQDQKEKNSLDYNDQKAIKDFLRSQQQQEALMEKFSRKLQETMDTDKTDQVMDKLLKERLERQEIEARKNERLLEELQRIADKIDKEELTKKLEEVGKRQQNSKRNLSQLLELTKQYYVTEKANQIATKLDKLAEKQDLLSGLQQERKFNLEEQEKINSQFMQIEKDMDELRQANKELQKPLAIETDKKREQEIRKDLNNALEDIQRGEEIESSDEQDKNTESTDNSARKNQRKAAGKMKQMAQSLQQSAMSGGAESMAEDAEMLRQILENLIIFSLKQEDLLDRLTKEGELDNFSVGVVREEQQLKELFEHVDDSLFALSLRQAEISEFVNEQVTEVYYNIESSLENLSEGQSYRAGANQQAVLTAANNLADFLADVLSNMQQSLAQGQGGGKPQDGFQLPDIIKGQEEIQKGMQEMGSQKKGEQADQGEKGEGNKSEDGSGQKGDSQKEQGIQGEGNTGEEEMEELYEIYKQQQILRAKLEEQLQDMINTEERNLAERLSKQMEEFEKDLIENGITERTLSKVNRIRQQLMKLENAAMEQGQKEERESERVKGLYDRPVIRRRDSILKDKEIIELLQRQALPLQEFYGEALKRYFREND